MDGPCIPAEVYDKILTIFTIISAPAMGYHALMVGGLPAGGPCEPVHQRHDQRLKQLPRHRLWTAGEAERDRERPLEDGVELCGLHCKVLRVLAERPAIVCMG